MLHAITVCVDYADFLRLSIFWNKRLFDRWTIVTVPEDKDTIQLCEENGLEIAFTERLKFNNANFNRGAAINDGIAAAKPTDWVAIIDADTLLLEDLRPQLHDTYSLYSTHRTYLFGWDSFVGWLKGEPLRACCNHDCSYGFLQVVHNGHPYVQGGWYSEQHGDASASDLDFRDRWEFNHERKHFTQCCVHVGPTAINWHGRKSAPFYTKEMLREVRSLIERKTRGADTRWRLSLKGG